MVKFNVKPITPSFEYEVVYTPGQTKYTFQNAIETIFHYHNVHLLVKNSCYDDDIVEKCFQPRFEKAAHAPFKTANTPFHRMLISQQYSDAIRLDDLVVDILERRFKTRIIILEKNRTTLAPFTLQFLSTSMDLEKFTVVYHDTATMEFFPLRIHDKIVHDQLTSTFLNEFICS